MAPPPAKSMAKLESFNYDHCGDYGVSKTRESR